MKKTISVLGFLLLIFIPYQINGQNKNYIIGFSYGYSFGLTNEYKKNENLYPAILSKAVYQYKLGSSYGLNFQYYFSSHWGIQGEVVYQRKTYHRWELGNPEYIHDESYIMPYFNVIYKFNSLKENTFFPYFFTGLGIRDFLWPVVALKFQIGTGMKYRIFSKVNFIWKVVLCTTDFTQYSFPENIDYISINIGLEHGF